MQWRKFVGPDNAKCLILPVKIGRHYSVSESVQAYSSTVTQ